MNTNSKLMELLKEVEKECYTTTAYEKLYNAILDNIREESAAGIGSKKQLTIIKSMLASVKNNNGFKKAHVYNDSFAFLDGVRIFISNNDFNYEKADLENTFKIDPIISEAKSNNTLKIKIDTCALAAHIKQYNKKDNKTFIIQYNDNFIGVNPYYLRDSLQFVNNDFIFVNPGLFKNHVYKSPIYFCNDNNDMSILLPVNISASDNLKCDMVIIEEVKKDTKKEEYLMTLEKEVEEENNTTILENRKEFNRLYSLVADELNNGILKAAPDEERFNLADRYDCIISLHEDINNLTLNINDFKLIDHMNYKLYNYDFNYVGAWNDNDYKFEYRTYKVYNHLHQRVTRYALESIEIFLSQILEYKQPAAAAV